MVEYLRKIFIIHCCHSEDLKRQTTIQYKNRDNEGTFNNFNPICHKNHTLIHLT